MKPGLHAVILAHPKSDSFMSEVARTLVAVLEEIGHECDLRDLYRMNFDPRLGADEIPTEGSWSAAADVQAERARLDSADAITFLYPIWFNGPPAILKGYIDRVFGMGFGYDAVMGGTEPRLTGKRFFSISASGAPEAWFKETGAMDALLKLTDLHLCQVTGMTFVDHLHLGGLHAALRPDEIKQRLDRVRSVARRLFSLAPASV